MNRGADCNKTAFNHACSVRPVYNTKIPTATTVMLGRRECHQICKQKGDSTVIPPTCYQNSLMLAHARYVHHHLTSTTIEGLLHKYRTTPTARLATSFRHLQVNLSRHQAKHSEQVSLVGLESRPESPATDTNSSTSPVPLNLHVLSSKKSGAWCTCKRNGQRYELHPHRLRRVEIGK